MSGLAMFVGDVSWDTTIVAARLPELDEKVIVEVSIDAVGGVAANSAAACALAGADVLLVSIVGNDMFGVAVKNDLASRQLNSTLVTTSGATTRAFIILDSTGFGEKRLFLYPGDRMYPSLHQVEALELTNVDWVHTALYDLPASAELISRCRKNSIPWSIDLEPATIPDDFPQLGQHLDGCSFVIVNSRAANVLGAEVVGRLRALGAQTIIETLGPDGARVNQANNTTITIPPQLPMGKVRDTTGAGDAFAGWLVSGMLQGTSIEEATNQAVAAASLSVQRLGSVSSYPTREEMSKAHFTR